MSDSYREISFKPTKEALRVFALEVLKRHVSVEGSYCMGRDWFVLLKYRGEQIDSFRMAMGKWITFDGPPTVLDLS